MDATGCAGHAQPASPAVQWCPEATMLLGIPGLVVTHVAQDEDGATVVHAVTHPTCGNRPASATAAAAGPLSGNGRRPNRVTFPGAAG